VRRAGALGYLQDEQGVLRLTTAGRAVSAEVEAR
jgi:hypothetical protein